MKQKTYRFTTDMRPELGEYLSACVYAISEHRKSNMEVLSPNKDNSTGLEAVKRDVLYLGVTQMMKDLQLTPLYPHPPPSWSPGDREPESGKYWLGLDTNRQVIAKIISKGKYWRIIGSHQYTATHIDFEEATKIAEKHCRMTLRWEYSKHDQVFGSIITALPTVNKPSQKNETDNIWTPESEVPEFIHVFDGYFKEEPNRILYTIERVSEGWTVTLQNKTKETRPDYQDCMDAAFYDCRKQLIWKMIDTSIPK
jgi:hypothetical protein